MIAEHTMRKIKQELIPIACLSIFQIWYSFMFPAFTRLGIIWNGILGLATSILGIILILYLFSNANRFTHLFDNSHGEMYTDTAFEGYIGRFSMLLVFHMWIFFTWYYDTYHMLSIYYVLQYGYCAALFLLLYKAAYRIPEY